MPTLVLANAGVPMLMVYGPVLLLALIPIIMIETEIINQSARLGFGAMLWRVGVANALSTLVGVPLTWLALVVIQLITGGGTPHGVGWHSVIWQAPWLIPHEEDLHWMIPAAGLVLTVPFWLVSVLIESMVLAKLCAGDLLEEDVSIKRLCLIANACSYALLGMFWVVPLVIGAVRGA